METIAKQFQAYDINGEEKGRITGFLLDRYGPYRRCSKGFYLQTADINPADGSPTVTVYLRAEVKV
jgi:hypothetical protein